MPTPTRSSVAAFEEETTEGVLAAEEAADFVPLRDGFDMKPDFESLDSDEIINDIGATKSYQGKAIPKGTFPMYLRHSGTAGTAPEYAVLIKSAMGTQTNNGTEYSVTAGSSAGTSAARGSLEMAANDEDNFLDGQAVLIKDGVNGYSIRNVYDVNSAGNQLDLNFNIATAPASGVALGKANHFSPASDDHVTFSAYHYGASSGSDYKQAISGCRTTSINMDFPANGFATINFDIEGIEHYWNFMEVTSSNNKINFKEAGGGAELTATLDSEVYNSPLELAAEVASKMTAASTLSRTYTVSFNSSTGKFTISVATFLSILWKTGTNGSDNTDTHAGTLLGYSDAADDTGAVTYDSDNAQTYSPSVTPTYDGQDNIVLKASELMIGGYADYTTRKVIKASCTIGTPKTDVPDLANARGIDSSLIASREAVFTCTILMLEHEAELYDRFLNNTTSSLMFNTGHKSAGNWVAGKCFNLYFPNCTLRKVSNIDNDGYRVFEIEAKAFVDSSQKDVHINYI